jgi:hypothetical protein
VRCNNNIATATGTNSIARAGEKVSGVGGLTAIAGPGQTVHNS